jgi:2-polyprenyl-3-methyl-5-hydroxy-6-metoxy-1,4-benzoquinol methylase
MDVTLTDEVSKGRIYLEEATEFLKEFLWLIDFKWIDIFLNDIIHNIPNEWHDFLSNVETPHLKELMDTMSSNDERCPQSFRTFLHRCKLLSVRLEWPQHSTPIPHSAKANKTSVKKLRESINFGEFIAGFCSSRFTQEELNKTVIIDIGCGLGYVSSQLRDKGFRVIGVDARPELCESANRRIGDELMSFVHHFVSETRETRQFIENLIPAGYKGILIALHGCGDLLDRIINLFIQSEKFKGLFCVTCCYHKISKMNYPRSESLRSSSSRHDLSFDPVNMRSACQKTPQSWTSELTADILEVHTVSAAFRAILEEVQVQTNYIWKKTKSRMKQSSNIHNFVGQALLGFPEEMRNDALCRLQDTIERRKDSLDRVRTLKILQILIQPVVESVIVFDHIIKLREHGLKSGGAQVFSQIISPRNTAVIAMK